MERKKQMEILIEIKNVYGNTVTYPVCDKAKLFAALAKTSQLTHNTLCLIERLGFTIKVKEQTYNQQVLTKMLSQQQRIS